MLMQLKHDELDNKYNTLYENNLCPEYYTYIYIKMYINKLLTLNAN